MTSSIKSGTDSLTLFHPTFKLAWNLPCMPYRFRGRYITVSFPYDDTSSAERTRCLCTAAGRNAPRTAVTACIRTRRRTDSSSNAGWKTFSAQPSHPEMATHEAGQRKVKTIG